MTLCDALALHCRCIVQLFEVELLRWESVNDLSDEKDGSLMKTTIQDGDLDVWDRPKDPDLVTIKMSAKVAGTTEYFVKDEETEFTVADGYFCPAVKIAVSEMKKGESVSLKVGNTLLPEALTVLNM